MKKISIYKIISALFSSLLVFLIIPSQLPALTHTAGCMGCHNLHAAPGQALTTHANFSDLCLGCHGESGSSSLKAEVHIVNSGALEIGCVECHNPHNNPDNWLGGTNIKLIGHNDGSANITTTNSGVKDVVFHSRGSDSTDINYPAVSLHSFADNDEDTNSVYDGVCEVCHTSTAYHRNNSSGDHSHSVGTECTACHAHDDNFAGSGGGCKACHSSIQDDGDGPPRRAIVGEFSLASHHVMGGIVTDEDCEVCHYESVDSSYHKDEKVDLRNPDDDSVGALISFTQFSRNTASDTLETMVTDVQNNLCLKCHDSGGVTRIGFVGNPLQPFSSADRDVPNVAAQFARDSHHPVISVENNPYCVPSSTNGNNITMESPWNQTAVHDKISCFDCHGTSGHGSANQRMLRTSIDIDAMKDGNLTDGSAVDTFCTLCHKSSVYISASDPEAVGSIFESHPGGQNQHASSELGCMSCHGGIIDWSGSASGNGAALGNIHGTSYDWGNSSDLPVNFLVGGYLEDLVVSSTQGTCKGGQCGHSNSGKRWTR